MSEELRRAFEEWARTKLRGVGLTTHRGEDDEYHYDYVEVDIAWEAWQASNEYAKKTMCNRN